MCLLEHVPPKPEQGEHKFTHVNNNRHIYPDEVVLSASKAESGVVPEEKKKRFLCREQS